MGALAIIREELSATRPLRCFAAAEPEDHLFDDLGLDELDRVTVAISLEERFGLDLSDAAIARWHHVSDLVACIAGVREVAL